MVYTVCNGLSQGNINTWCNAQFITYFFKKFFFGFVLQNKRNINFRGIYALGVFVSSARPCLRVTTSTSGNSNRIRSTSFPVLLLSFKDIPGGPTTLITIEPSLNSGRKLLPNCVTTKRLNTKAITVTPMMVWNFCNPFQ